MRWTRPRPPLANPLDFAISQHPPEQPKPPTEPRRSWRAQLLDQRTFGKFEPVATQREHSLRLRIYFFVFIELCLVGVVILVAQRGSSLIAVLSPVGGILVCNVVLLTTIAKLSGSHYSARSRLRSKGYKICPQCQYNLNNLPDQGACPECGFSYTPEILKERWELHYKWTLEKPGR